MTAFQPEDEGKRSSFEADPQFQEVELDPEDLGEDGEGMTSVEIANFLDTPLDQLESYAGTIPNRTRRRTNG